MYEHIFSLPMTARVERIRQLVLQHPVANARNVYASPDYPLYYSGDRWLTKDFLDGWELYRTQPTTQLRRAYAEAYLLDHSQPLLDGEELLAGRLDLRELSPEEKAELQGRAKEFNRYAPYMNGGRHDHICLDWPKLLSCGVNGLLQEIRERQSQLDFDDPATIRENVEKEEFYSACQVELEALLRYAARYAAEARRLAEEEKDPTRRENLLTVAVTLEHVPANPARTFREALQSVHFYVFNLFGLYPGGQPDRYLLEFYQRDLASGILTPELAQELVDDYCLKFSTYVFSRAANSIMLAGSDESGAPVGNAVTAHFLHSISHVRRPDPNFSLAASPDTDQELFDYALKMNQQGYCQPAFYNDKGLQASLIAHGVAPEDACHFINTTCSEISICGKSNKWTTCPFVNVLGILDEVIHSGQEFKSLQEMLSALKAELVKSEAMNRYKFNLTYLERRRNGAEPFRVSCLINDCLALGKSIWDGGAVYNSLSPSYYGISNAAEVLSTYQELVFGSGEYTFAELTAIVDSDYRDNEELRLRIINKLPHYGNGDSKVDGYMVELTQMIQEICRDKINYRGGRVLPGAFAYMMHGHGQGMGAKPSADGRHAGEALASCPGPLNGFDRNGPTAALYSSSTWKQTDFLGGITMNLRLTKKELDAAGVSRLRDLVLGFFARDGKQLQLNCVNTDEMREAMEHPERYGDLIVRVGGYTEYFVRLSRDLQLDLISRTENQQ